MWLVLLYVVAVADMPLGLFSVLCLVGCGAAEALWPPLLSAWLELVVVVSLVVVLFVELVLFGFFCDLVEVRVAVVCPAVWGVRAVCLHFLDPFWVSDAEGFREPLFDVLASWCAAVSSLVVAAFGVDGVVGVVSAVVCAATVC